MLVELLLLSLTTVFARTESPDKNKDCNGSMITTTQQLNELSQQNCTVIVGPLIIQGLELDYFGHLPSLDTVRQITQFLVIQNLGEHYTTISQLLPNLAVIRGSQTLDNEWTLVITDNAFLSDLGWSALPVIRQGDALVTNNPQLSRQTILTLANSLTNAGQSLVSIGMSLRTNRSDSCELPCPESDRDCEEKANADKCQPGNEHTVCYAL
jgi:hypothetical protein